MTYPSGERELRANISDMGFQRTGQCLVRGIRPLALWDMVADTDLINRLIGTPTSNIRYQPHGVGESLRIVDWTLKGRELQYEEERFQWEVGRWYLIHRRVLGGPLERLKYLLVTQPRGDDTLVEVLTGADARAGEPSEGMGTLVDELSMHHPLVPLLDQLSSMSQPRWVAPGTPVDEVKLTAGIRALTDLGECAGVTGRLAEYLRTAMDADLIDMAPRRLARAWGDDPDAVVGCFLRATRLGLLQAQWSVVCPSCRGPKGGKERAFDLSQQAHCDDCNLTFDTDPRQNMQLGFCPAEGLRAATAGRACVGSPVRTPHILAQAYLEPGATRVLLEPHAGMKLGNLRLRCTQLQVEHTTDNPLGVWRLEHGSLVRTGDADAVVLHNTTQERLRFLLEEPPPYSEALLAADVLDHPGFSGLFGAEEWEYLAAMTGVWREGFGATGDPNAGLGTHFDLAVVGSGPAGETLAISASQLGAKVALVETREVFGGPTGLGSKAFREATIKVLSWSKMSDTRPSQETIKARFDARFATFRDHVVLLQSHELMGRLSGAGVCLVRGRGRLDPEGLSVTRTDGSRIRISATHIGLAVGSKAARPAHVPFDGRRVLDAEEVSGMATLPRSVAIIGGGIIACEYATMFGALGVHTHVIHAYDTYLPDLDRNLRDGLIAAAEALGVTFLRSVEVESWAGGGVEPVTITLSNATTVTADLILYARGREGSTRDLASPEVALEQGKRGFLRVGADLTTGQDHVYALGDVAGPPGLASAATAQGSRLAEQLFGDSELRPEPPCPTVIWTLPEVASVGLTLDQAHAEDRGGVQSARAEFRELPRGILTGDLNGWLELIIDGRAGKILGVHILGAGASELIHFGSQLIATETTCSQLARQVFAAVTLHDLFRIAAQRAETSRLVSRRAASRGAQQIAADSR